MGRIVIALIVLAALAGCRGEPVPRDYQNAPPAMTHPPATKAESPGAHNQSQAKPEPNAGPEGTAGPYAPVPTNTTGTTSTEALPDQAPATTTT